MSQWYYRSLDSEIGPVSFTDLARFICVGTLEPNDLVSRSRTGDWQPAREVVGLLRAASKMKAEVGLAKGDVSARADAAPATSSEPQDAVGDRTHHSKLALAPASSLWRVRTAVAGCVAAMLALGVLWELGRSERFPPKRSPGRAPTYSFPVVGEVSGLGMVLLWGDVTVLACIAVTVVVDRLRKQ